MIYLLAALISLPSANASFLSRMKVWCARYLVADHPYVSEVKNMGTLELVEEFRAEGGKRFWKAKDTDEYEMALAELLRRYHHDNLTGEERDRIFEAFQDYPDVRTYKIGAR